MNAVTEIIPGPGHNSASFVEMVENDPGVVFREAEVLPALIKEIRDEIKSAKIDLSTDKGRKAIASRAAKIARRKTAIDNAGKDLNEEARRAINAVDAVRRDARAKLDELRDDARAPLDEWEAAEEARREGIERGLKRLSDLSLVPIGATLADVDEALSDLQAIDVSADAFGEDAGRAVMLRDRAVESWTESRARIEREEAERAELERLRAEQAKREAEEATRQEAERQKEHEQRIREEAAREAERKAQEEVERVKREAEEARKEAERKAAKAEEDRVREEERKRVEEERRQRDRALVARACGAAKSAIIAAGSVDESTAKAIVLAIHKGEVPGVTLKI